MSRKKSYYIESYGCQMNFAESNALEARFQAAGYQAAAQPEDADIVILNTCSVRKTAENRIWGRIGFYKHLKEQRDLKLIVTGCMAQRLGEQLKERGSGVDIVVGTNDKIDIGHLLDDSLPESDEYSFATSYFKEGEHSAFVPIMNGCNNFCAYCIVPYVRGPEVSRSVDSIIEEVLRLQDRGIREITLLGQNVNSYSHDGLGFTGVLQRILEAAPEIEWVRFLSAHPKDFSPELIELIASSERLCSHIHLPLQSGSSAILKKMNRRYDASRYLSIVDRLRELDGSMSFTTDIMVGFPQETEADHQMTLEMMRRVGYSEAYMYYYNPREGTASTSMTGQVPESIKLERLQEVIDLQAELGLDRKKREIGKTVRLLCDSMSKRDSGQYVGHSEHGHRIVFDRDTSLAPGTFVQVRLTELRGTTFKGEQICPGR